MIVHVLDSVLVSSTSLIHRLRLPRDQRLHRRHISGTLTLPMRSMLPLVAATAEWGRGSRHCDVNGTLL